MLQQHPHKRSSKSKFPAVSCHDISVLDGHRYEDLDVRRECRDQLLHVGLGSIAFPVRDRRRDRLFLRRWRDVGCRGRGRDIRSRVGDGGGILLR